MLFGLATLQLRGDFTRPVSHAGFGMTVLYYGGTALFVAAWLAALLRCGCSGARPPARSSSRRASRRPCRVMGEPC